MADERLIAALDVPTRAAAEELVVRLGDSVSYYKVGMELFYALGGDIVMWLKGEGKQVFLDLKLHDIPNTVGKRAVLAAASWPRHSECPYGGWAAHDAGGS